MNVSEALVWWNIIRRECGPRGIVWLCLNHIMPSLKSIVKRHSAAALCAQLVEVVHTVQWHSLNNLTSLSNVNYTPMSCSLQNPICSMCHKLLNSQFNMISTFLAADNHALIEMLH